MQNGGCQGQKVGENEELLMNEHKVLVMEDKFQSSAEQHFREKHNIVLTLKELYYTLKIVLSADLILCYYHNQIKSKKAKGKKN